MTHGLPLTSIIVPARNCANDLRLCLESVRDSEFEDYEVIVVDDGSTDETAQTAAEFGAQCLRLADCRGPANARNVGAEVAQGRFLVFLDADVQVHPQALGRMVGRLVNDPSLSAVFGSYDDDPGAGNLLSQYRNLLHHFTHQTSSDDAQTFWAGCGAVRAQIFRELGGFDVRYRSAAVEDIEFGYRLKSAGCRIALEKQALCKHMKKWRLWNMVATDIFRRGFPWTVLIFERRMLNNDLNLKISQRLSIVLTYLLATIGVLAVVRHPSVLIWLLGAVIALLCLDAWTDQKTVPRYVRILSLIVLGALGGIAAVVNPPLTLLALTALSAIVLLNWDCYAYLARTRYPLFAMTVVPLHLVYFLAAGFGFGLGGLAYLFSSRNSASTARRAPPRPLIHPPVLSHRRQEY